MISGESYLGSLEIELLNGISKLSLEIPNLLVIYKIVLFNETHTNTNKLTNWINFVETRIWGIDVLSFVVQKVFKGNSSRPVQRGLIRYIISYLESTGERIWIIIICQPSQKEHLSIKSQEPQQSEVIVNNDAASTSSIKPDSATHRSLVFHNWSSPPNT